LALLGVEASQDLYGKLEGEGLAKVWAMFKRNESLGKSITDKAVTSSPWAISGLSHREQKALQAIPPLLEKVHGLPGR
jgi:hypothetical protein